MTSRNTCAAVVVSIAIATTAVPPATAQIADDELTFRARLGADYLVSVQLPNGLFAYEYDFLAAGLVEADSIVRQAGTAFGVAVYLNWSGVEAYRESVKRALAALAAYSRPYDEGMVLASRDRPSEAPTGATALALLAELNYVEATGDTAFEETRRGWVRALTALQNPAGGMDMAPNIPVESPFYNGEAWLALAHYNRLFPEDALAANVLTDADDYLMDLYTEAPNPSFFQWGLMAAAVRYRVTGDPRFLDFIAGQSEAYLTDLSPSVRPTNNGCAAVEGLAAGAAALASAKRDVDSLHQRMLTRIDAELTKSLGFQIMPGQGHIRLGAERHLVDPGVARFAGAVLNGRYQARTRVDSTVHCLSALINYEQMRQARGGRR